MKALRFHKSAFERQIYESVQIQANRKHFILNSKIEYNRCALPRLTLKLGDKNVKELEKDIEEEKRKEEVLERKIRELRNRKNKERGEERKN